jgi:hypothetical protein
MPRGDNDNGPAPKVDPRLKEFATRIQAQYIDAVNEVGVMEAARRFGVKHQVVQGAVKAVKKKAAAQGFAPGNWVAGVAAGYTMGKVTVHRNADGSVIQTWERQHPDALWLEQVREAVDGFVEGVEPATVAEAPLDFQTDVIPWIQIGDAHFGMLAHAAETGVNFDLKIAEAELCGAIGLLIDEAPACERMVINDLGDFTHYENFRAETEASGHRLDADGRFPKMIKVYSRVMRWIVEKALEKAQHVDVIVNQGNHSRTNDIWMAELLRVAFGHTGRVHVLNNDNVFIAYRMGNTLVMTHHSDKCRPHQLAHVMTTDFRQDYGETEFHYIDIGHVHHKMVVKEHPGVSVESFNILAAPDKWAHEGGYRSRRMITMVLRSRTYGEVGRRVLPIQEVWDRLSLKSAPPRRAFAA